MHAYLLPALTGSRVNIGINIRSNVVALAHRRKRTHWSQQRCPRHEPRWHQLQDIGSDIFCSINISASWWRIRPWRKSLTGMSFWMPSLSAEAAISSESTKIFPCSLIILPTQAQVRLTWSIRSRVTGRDLLRKSFILLPSPDYGTWDKLHKIIHGQDRVLNCAKKSDKTPVHWTL